MSPHHVGLPGGGERPAPVDGEEAGWFLAISVMGHVVTYMAFAAGIGISQERRFLAAFQQLILS
jgi:hypothetical protein